MYSDIIDDAMLNMQVILKLRDTWNNRVSVRKDRLDFSSYYDPVLPDFPISLVPFWKDREFDAVDEKTRLRILAGAWIMYNEKTIFIEDKIINPLCRLLLRDEIPGVSDSNIKEVVAQTLVDEQFHILMCLEVCNHARARHELKDLVINKPLLITRSEQAIERVASSEEYVLLRLAYAMVAEMTINTYLKLLSSDQTIQPLNRINTDMHRQDEAAHSPIFKEITLSVYQKLTPQQCTVFIRYLNLALDNFTEHDYSGWMSILAYLEIPNTQNIIMRMNESMKGKRLTRDFGEFKVLIDEIGITEEIML